MMAGKLIHFAYLAVVVTLALATHAAAQDFQKSYPLPAGGTIRIGNISGDVKVIGYDGNTVIVTGTKNGADAKMLDFQDNSSGDVVDVSAHYPEHCRNCDAGADFQVQVPRSTSYNFDRISSISGDVSIDGASGRLNASSVSGDVHVTGCAGSVSAKSVSGDVAVELTRLDGSDPMEFHSVSGDVTAKLPANLDADVEMSSFSGDLETDFPLTIEKKENGPSQRASGRLGSGGRSLKLSTVSGSVSLKHL